MQRKDSRQQAECRNQRGKGRVQASLAGARVLRICCGRRSGRLAGYAFLGIRLPDIQKLVGLEEQHGADRRLIETARAGLD